MTSFWSDDPMAPRIVDERAYPGLRLRRVSCRPDARQPVHEHPRPCLVIALRGAYQGRMGSESWESRAGDVAMVPAARSHSQVISPAGGEAVLVELLPERIAAEPSSKPLAGRLWQQRGATLRPLVDKIARELRADDSAADLVIESTILEILAAFSRRAAVKPAPAWLVAVRERLDADYADPPSLSLLALDAGVSRAHLARTFKTVVGCSVGDYVRRRRLSRAAELLQTDRQLADVALSCGFYDQSHFCRTFRRHFGTAPSTWRST